MGRILEEAREFVYLCILRSRERCFRKRSRNRIFEVNGFVERRLGLSVLNSGLKIKFVEN